MDGSSRRALGVVSFAIGCALIVELRDPIPQFRCLPGLGARGGDSIHTGPCRVELCCIRSPGRFSERPEPDCCTLCSNGSTTSGQVGAPPPVGPDLID